MLFHTHFFKPHESERSIYCMCGVVKILPCIHIWKKYAGVVRNIDQRKVAESRVCEKCGEIKVFSVVK